MTFTHYYHDYPDQWSLYISVFVLNSPLLFKPYERLIIVVLDSNLYGRAEI